MIDSRRHAALDVGLIAALAAVAVAPGGSPRVRAVAGVAALVQGGVCAVTDYEGGVVARFSLQEHRACDVALAAALGVAGAGLRSRVLSAIGVGVLAVALSSAGHTHPHAHGGVPELSYPPLDVPKRLARDVWIVDSVVGPGIPARMTVVRLGDGTLLLHSPTRFSAGLRRMLEAMGPIRHLVAPNSVHWMFVKGWQDAVPGCVTYGAPELGRRTQVRRSGLRIDQELSARAPRAWAGEIDQEVIAGGAGFREVAMFHRASNTLLMTDLVQNFEPQKLPWVVRPIAWALGNTTRLGRAPAHLRAVMWFGRPGGAEAARRVVEWRPERVVVTHGRVIGVDAAARLARSFQWLTG